MSHNFVVGNANWYRLADVYVEEELDLRVVKLLQKLMDAVGREISVQKSLHQVLLQIFHQTFDD